MAAAAGERRRSPALLQQLRRHSVGQFNLDAETMSTCKKARAEAISVGCSDRLSSLPAEIRGDILSRLNVEEAVRTSTLSSSWRDAWTDMPNIFLRDGTFTRTKFVTLVDMVLLLHRGTIGQFDISGNKNYHDEFARWMLMLSRRSPKSVIIKLSSGPRYNITSCLFSISDLEFMRLEKCIISLLQVFQGFKRLTDLGLKFFSSTDMDIQNLISFCPELTHLRLTSFLGDKCLNIRAHKLKYLDVDGGFEAINLDAPNLERAIVSVDEEAKVYQSVPIAHGKQSLGMLSKIKKTCNLWLFPEVSINTVHTYNAPLCVYLPGEYFCYDMLLGPESYPWSTWDQDQASIHEFTVQMQMDRLATASVNGFGGLECEVNFVAKLLSWAPALEDVKIEWKGKTQCSAVLAKLLALPRASPGAKVIVT